MTRLSVRALGAAAAIVVCGFGTAVSAQGTSTSGEAFFKGKTITLLIGGTAGGGLDTAEGGEGFNTVQVNGTSLVDLFTVGSNGESLTVTVGGGTMTVGTAS